MPLELTEEQLQEKIDAGIAAATKGLKEKNEELIGKIKKAQEKADAEAEAKRLAEEKAEQDRLAAEGKHDELLKRVRENAESEIKALKERAEKAEKSLEKATNSLRVMLVDNEISKRLVEAGVTNPDLLEAATALITPKAEIVDGENEGEQVVKIGGAILDDFFKTWKEGKGKAFITNGNSGGGGNGSGNNSGAGNDWEVYFKSESVNLTKQTELQNTDVELYKQLRAKYPLVTSTPVRGVN